MLERKHFKTKLCVPFQRGRCARHNCSFAHGNAELRRFSGSYSGRRDYSGNDLRDKLDRRHLSPPRYSPARNARGYQNFREYSPSRSLEKRSDRKHRKKRGFTGQSDSGSLKVSDRIQDRVKDGKLLSSGSRNALEEQLKKVQLDINKLEHQKFELGVYLDESVQEVDSLNSRIHELEAQLCKENEESKRITSKIKKFIKVHNHNSWLQDELKRSQVRLQRLGDELASDITKSGANEEDLSIDIMSNDKSKFGHLVETARARKRSRWNLPAQSNDKGYEGFEVPNNGTEVIRPLYLEDKRKRSKSNSCNVLSSEKLKESRIGVPSTSMAAHMADEEVEIELDDKIETIKTAYTENENGVAFKKKGLQRLPPLLTPGNNYSQYEVDDENVDVDGVDEEVAMAQGGLV